MEAVETVIVGAGQAGLAVSAALTAEGREHVVLERGRVAEKWRSERWDSFRLLTPNWHTRLPGHRYDGDDPDGFMTGAEAIGMFERYAASFGAPVREHVTVESVTPHGGTLTVRTNGGALRARNVVVATGHFDTPLVPAAANSLPADVLQLHTASYRNPEQLPGGRVLVVGAGASAQQIADELARAGREVTIAIGHHTRSPRRYRGRDVFWWGDRMGSFAQTVHDVADVEAARRAPSMAATGSDGGRDLDLQSLARLGVRVTGHVRAVEGDRVVFAEDVAELVAAGDAKAAQFRAKVDAFVARHRLELPEEPWPADPPAWPPVGVASLDLRAERIGAVVWGTGFRRSYDWLHAPVTDRAGQVVQCRGVSPVRGVYFVGLRFMYRRDSHFIDGVGHDAVYVARHIAERADHGAIAA